MLEYANVAINIFSVLLLLILFINMYRPNGEYLPDQKLFLMMLVSDAALLVFDSMQWIFDGIPGIVSHNISQISTSIYYVIDLFPTMLWCLYVRYQFSMDIKKAMKAAKLLTVPFIINTVITILSYTYGLYFFIDKNNFYQRGEYFWICPILIYFYMIYACIYIIANRRKTEKRILISLLIFPLPPLLGSVIQITSYGLALIWPCVALSLLIIYINIQKNQLYTDYLTGLYNRRLMDIHLDDCIKKNGVTEGVGVIMLDIDGFKSINDALGHIVGDQALVETASILKKSVGRNGFIARYGGDEFVVIVSAKDASDIERVTNEIDHNIEQNNKKDNALYNIHLSMGYEIFECGGSFSKWEILNRIDQRMYENKLRS